MPLLIVFCGFMLFASANWIIRKFGPVTYEQIMFHLNMPFHSEVRLILSYLQNTVMLGAIIVFLLWLFTSQIYHLKFNKIEKIRSYIYDHRWFLSLSWFIFCAIYFFIRMNVWTMLTYQSYKREVSNFYEKNYVFPQNTKITFPENKKNLIIIFLESMESTFAQTPRHNYFQADLIPELHNLAKQNIHFSDSEYLGGEYPIDGTQWTQAALFAKTCGAPIQLPIKEVYLISPKGEFYPNAWCLYDILAEQGYNESFLVGSSGTFAGLDHFVKTHRNQRLLDILHYAKERGEELSYKERGESIADKELFVLAKDELTRLAEQNKPFVFTMMTLDTHFGSQEFSGDVCGYKYGRENNLENVVSCADFQIGQFIKWLEQQPFYKDSVIVLLGDHLMMNDSLKEDMIRHPLNIFINADISADKTQNRIFTPFDIYPTIVESMGAKINGHRLGLGASLFSDIPTLTEEKMTIEEMDIGVRKSSKIYDWLLYGKELKQ
ncbi:MAG: LTA synthase family protein [Alphaproteobacteria bacterium]|nr:LTA synthase family protein [Alphaproteobacteria bacterium]